MTSEKENTPVTRKQQWHLVWAQNKISPQNGYSVSVLVGDQGRMIFFLFFSFPNFLNSKKKKTYI